LGKDDFLKLLLVELQYQDPTAPMDTEKILTQTSQLATLEASANTTKALEELAASLKTSQNFNTVAAIGKMADLGSNGLIYEKGYSTDFEMYFPSDIASGQVEILDTDGNIIPPNLFLENAKESGLYPNITRIMIEKTLAKFRDIKCEVSINLSIIDIRDTKMREFILNRVKNFPEPKRIVFELLETERINDFELINDFIDKLKEIGGKIAIDDFGSGYSNMIYLARIKSDYIKMDGSIIKELLTDDKVAQTVEVINNYSKITNQRVIAEFVSNKDIQKKIEQIGVAFSQGYYIGKPQEALLPADFKLPQK